MTTLRQLWRSFFDIRPGERLRVLFMFLNLLLILFAYYVLKVMSQALFLAKFDIEKLPFLTILVAAFGGFLAYVYTKLAVRTSLSQAVFWSSAVSVAVFVGLWFLIQHPTDWVYYALNILVSLFSIVMVSQGWLVAANVFNPREAKRVYGILGLGAVIGAAFGGSFTAFVTRFVGVNNLLLVSAGIVILAYGAYLGLVRLPGVSLARAKAADEEEADFAFGDIVSAILKYRHLQVIIGIITLTYIVDVLVTYQFSAMAKAAYSNKEELTAFLGSFYGIYLNLITFSMQFFLTALVVSTFGVGGTLQIMPVAIGIASMATLTFPSVLSTSAARLSEAAARYTFNRTGMELLYLPLPAELKNRTKAFVDIFGDRFARGLGGLILILTTSVLNLQIRYVSVLILAFCGVWIALSALAKREYVATVRKRLESRRLDLENVRITVNDGATLQMLRDTARSGSPRQAAYALTMLEASQSEDVRPLLLELIESPQVEVRGKVLELARKTGCEQLMEQAQREIRMYRAGQTSPSIEPAVAYALAFSGEGAKLARRLLEHPNDRVKDATLDFLAREQGLAQELLTPEWLRESIHSQDPLRRRMGALAIRALGDGNVDLLVEALRDRDTRVAEAAMRTAGDLQHRAFIAPMVERLGEARLRGSIVDALTKYGHRISGTLGDALMDTNMPLGVRRHIARVLQRMPHQRSVDALMQAIGERDLTLRSTVLRSLHRMRELEPKFHYGAAPVQEQILQEARMYYELSAALSPFHKEGDIRTPLGLLAKTIEERLRSTIQRLFFLLGLKYPPREIYAAYLAVHRGKAEEVSTAIEFLDSVLDRELKKVLLPLFEGPDHLNERGREVFGLERMNAESALRRLLGSGDEWLVCCAIAAAAQLGMSSLREEISKLQSGAGAVVGRVAEDAMETLAV